MTTRTWHIPLSIIKQTEQAFLRGSHEVFVLWNASVTPGGAQAPMPITRCIVPNQRPGFSDGGVWVHIDGDELQRIQLDNFERKERSVVQLHTHPGRDVTMSRLDREWEVVRHVGALSIIAPFYGQTGLQHFAGVNVYEREPDDWRLWSPSEVAQRMVVI